MRQKILPKYINLRLSVEDEIKIKHPLLGGWQKSWRKLHIVAINIFYDQRPSSQGLAKLLTMYMRMQKYRAADSSIIA